MKFFGEISLFLWLDHMVPYCELCRWHHVMMSKHRTLHRTCSLLCFVFCSLGWFMEAYMGMWFSTVQREHVFVLQEKEVEVELVSGDGSLCVTELGLSCKRLETHGFQAESLPLLPSQGFSSTCRHLDVAVFLLDFSLMWTEPMCTGLVWYYFLICYNDDLNTLQSTEHC